MSKLMETVRAAVYAWENLDLLDKGTSTAMEMAMECLRDELNELDEPQSEVPSKQEALLIKMNVKVTMLDGREAWIHLPTPLWEGKSSLSPGVWLTGLYLGKESGRKVARTFYSWDGHETPIEGERYTQCDVSRWIRYCSLTNTDPQIEAEEL